MAAGVVLGLVALSVLVSVEGSSHVLKAVGDSVQLDRPDPGLEFVDCFWKFNGSTNVLKFYKKYNDVDPSPDYKDRVEFNNKTCSLTLKNVRRSDSGRYEVLLSTITSTVSKQVELSVLDPVETPVLTQQSSDPCNITLICRAHNLSVSSSCYNRTCQTKENLSLSRDVVLSLSINGSFMICNTSNPVSWKQAVINMEKFKSCDDKEDKPNPDPFPWWIVVIVVAVAVLLIAAGIFMCKWKQKGNATEKVKNTVYQEVGDTANTPPPVTSDTPSTVYCTVQATSRETTENQQPNIPLGDMPSNTYESVVEQMPPQPETIYATVQKSVKPVNEA